MAYNFLPCDREQPYLMPPSLADWLPDDHLAWFVLDAVDQLDLSAFYRRYREDGWGAPAFDPKMMVALLLYAYCIGERSSRRIERRLTEDVAFRVIASNQVPDHTTIARFRQQHEEALGTCFTEVLNLCRAAGLLRVGVVVLDGTKVEADAAIMANRSLAQIEEEVAAMLAEAARTDAEEDERFGPVRRGDELPEGLRDRRSRLARLAECKARLEQEEAQRQAAYQDHLARRAALEARRGRPLRGRKPKPSTPRSPATVKANPTDPGSRVMRGPRGPIQGYNAQTVLTEDRIVIACAITQEANDRRQLRPCSTRPRRTSRRWSPRPRSASCSPMRATGTSLSSSASDLRHRSFWSPPNDRTGNHPVRPSAPVAGFPRTSPLETGWTASSPQNVDGGCSPNARRPPSLSTGS